MHYLTQHVNKKIKKTVDLYYSMQQSIYANAPTSPPPPLFSLKWTPLCAAELRTLWYDV